MKDKIMTLASSIRFWMLFVGMLAILAAHYVPSMEFFFNTIATFLGAVIGIGTADSLAEKIAPKE